MEVEGSGEFFYASGTIREITVPAEGTIARERHDEAVERGDLVPLDATPVKVPLGDESAGSPYRWALPDGEDEPKARPRRKTTD